MKKIRFGRIHADYLTMHEAIDTIVRLAQSGNGGFVVTPNVDQVVLAEKNDALRAAYTDASLSLVDGMPLKWMSALVGEPLPEKISGSDLIRPLLHVAARHGLSVYLMGAEPGVARLAAENLEAEIPQLKIAGVDSPPLGFEKNDRLEQETVGKMVASKPSLVLLALGCPKQELLMHRWHGRYGAIVFLGIGAGLDFIAGKIKRCPPWMSKLGVEWAYRITQDPHRLLHRHLVRDAAILPIFAGMMKARRNEIIFHS